MRSDYSELIGFNTNEIEELASIIFSYSNLVYKKEDPAYHEYVASGYAISAILKSISNPIDSTSYFRKAAELYRKSDNPFCILLDICANNKDLSWNYSSDSRVATAFFLKAYQASYTADQIRLDYLEDDSFEQLINHNVPFSLYFRSIINISKLEIVGQLNRNIFRETLYRVSERTRLMMEDKYQWKSKVGYTFIPIEAESIAFGIIINGFLLKNRISTSQFRKILAVDHLEMLPLYISRDILNNSGNFKHFL